MTPQGSFSVAALQNRVDHYVSHAKAPRTTAQYTSAWNRWERFAKDHSLQLFPAKAADFRLYLASLADSSNSIQAVNMAVAAAAWKHHAACTPSPTDHPGVRLIVQGVRRKLAKPTTKKEPLSKDVLSKLVDYLIGQELRGISAAPLVHWRTAWRLVIEYTFLARWDDVSNLKPKHIKIQDNLLTVHFDRAKNDQFWEGNFAVAERDPASPFCVVALTEQYLTKVGAGDDEWLQCRVRSSPRTRHQVAKPSEKLSYSTALDDLRKALTAIGMPATLYGEHSGRHGGASDAVNAGCSQSDIQLQGRWRTVQTPLRYQKRSVARRLIVSKALRL